MTFDKLVKQEIPALLETINEETEQYKISFSYTGYSKDLNKYYDRSYCTMITLDVKIEDKHTGEFVTVPIDTLKVPIREELGFKLGKSHKQLLQLQRKAPGWYVLPPRKASGEEEVKDKKVELYPTLEYDTGDKKGFSFACSGNKIQFRIFKDTAGVDLSIFLKAITGMSNLELINRLGASKFVLNSFNNEIPTNQCIKRLAMAFNGKNRKQNDNFESDVTRLYKVVHERIFKRNRLEMNRTARYRYNINSSFTTRAMNKELAEDVVVNGETISKGTVLNQAMLAKFDDRANGVDSIKVQDNDKIYTLKRYVSNSDYLTVDEILTMLNVYINTLDGLGDCDDQYEYDSRINVSYNTLVTEHLMLNAEDIAGKIFNGLSQVKDESVDLKSVVSAIGFVNTDTLVNEISDSGNVMTQQSKDTNPIMVRTMQKKVVTDYGKKASDDAVKTHYTEVGKTDAGDQPESDKIGKVSHMTVLAKLDKHGFLITPYMRVVGGAVLGEEPVYLNAAQEANKYIAAWDEDFTEDKILCRFNDTQITVPKERVDYKDYSSIQHMSIARGFIPFPENSNSKRLQMGANHGKQAIPTLQNERPLVSTGIFNVDPFCIIRAEDILEEIYDTNKSAMDLYNEGEDINMSKEDFMKLPLKLVSTEIHAGKRTLTFEVIGTGLVRSKPIAFLEKTDAKSIFSNRINPVPNNLYYGRDIVVHNIGVDIQPKPLVKCVDYGNLNVDNFDEDLAIGVNLNVAFKTFESSTIEDAIVIRQGLCYDGRTTSVSINHIEETLFEKEGEYTESFGIYGDSYEPYMDTNGLPKVGTYLKPGSKVISKIRKTGLRTALQNRYKTLDSDTSGEVVSAYIQGDKAHVFLASLNPTECGDKMSARYGNKGVIGKVVPDHEMPFVESTGLTIDMILNPQGIPSRMNIGQVLEVALGMAMRKQGRISIVSPFNKTAKDFVMEQAKLNDVKYETLIDGRTGQRIERKVNVGVMYVLKLEHVVKKKMAAVNICKTLHPVTGQPKKGSGAQAVGEMETWALTATGCDKILQDMFSIQSDDLKKQRDLIDMIKANPNEIEISGESRNDIGLQAYLMSLGLKLSNAEDGSYYYSVLKDSEVRSLARRPLDVENDRSLYEEDIFGNCNTYSAKLQSNKNKFGYVELGAEVINPFMIQKKSILQSLPIRVIGTTGTSNALLTEEALDRILKGVYQVRMSLDEDSIATVKDAVISSPGTWISGLKAIKYICKNLDLNKVLATMVSDEFRFSPKDKLMEAKSNIEAWDKSGDKLSDLIISVYPILPAVFRPESKDRKDTSDYNHYYKALFSAIIRYRENKLDVHEFEIYKAISDFIGIKSTGKEEKINLSRGFLGKNTDKKSSFRTDYLGKRVNFSGRSVIIPAQDMTMDVKHIGIPLLMATTIWEIHLSAVLSKFAPLQQVIGIVHDEEDFYRSLLTYVASKNVYKFYLTLKEQDYKGTEEDVNNLFYEVRKAIIDFIEKQVITAGRQPTLHKYSVRGYNPKVTFNRAIEVHPLVCGGYNADFDGDTMYANAMLTEGAKQQALENLNATKGLINPKDSSIVIDHSQDIRLGIYFATMLHDNITDIRQDNRYKSIYYINSLQSLKTLVDSKQISIHDLVSVIVEGREYLSTAGRILFNELVDGFTENKFENNLNIPNINEENYFELKYDGLIGKKNGKIKLNGKELKPFKCLSLSDITNEAYTTLPWEESAKIYQSTMEFGFIWSDKSGITLGLQDLMIDAGVDKYKEQGIRRAEQIDEWAMKGLISDEGRKRERIKMYKSLCEFIENKTKDFLPRNNNLFIIKDSGARGNDSQIAQTIGIGGLTMKTLSESYEQPIMNSYSQGLTTFEMLIDVQGSRQGVISTQLGTADAGYFTRQLMYMLQGIYISKEDCGAKPIDLKLKYGDAYFLKFTGVNGEITEMKYDDVRLLQAELLDKELLFDESEEADLVKKYVKYIIPKDRHLDASTIEMLLKKKVRTIKCKSGTFEVRYKLTKMHRDLIIGRYCEVFKYTDSNGFIIPQGVDLIERENPITVPIRSMLACKCKEGVCQKCYGKAVDDTGTYPPVGSYVGILTAQSIGEPAAQLVLSLFHGGGRAGESVSSGVELASRVLRGGLPKRDTKAIHAPKSGHVRVMNQGKKSIISFSKSNFRQVPSESVKVVDGEYVEVDEIVTAGLPMINNLSLPDKVYIVENDKETFVVKSGGSNSIALDMNFRGTKEEIENFEDNSNYIVPYEGDFFIDRQYTLMEIYYTTFESNNIELHARHFELINRAQTNTIHVVNSNLTGVKPGNVYAHSDLVNRLEEQEGGFFMYGTKIADRQEVVRLNSGILAAMAFEFTQDQIAASFSNRQVIESNGPMGRLLVGEDFTNPEDRKDVSRNIRKVSTKTLNKPVESKVKVKENLVRGENLLDKLMQAANTTPVTQQTQTNSVGTTSKVNLSIKPKGENSVNNLQVSNDDNHNKVDNKTEAPKPDRIILGSKVTNKLNLGDK